MKLHDLKPAPGSRQARRRVGRGIAAGQGKTAGRGTKGQKARAGGSIPAWFEGGQTPLHQRIPKLHGFRNPFRIDYEVVNLGAIAHLVELGVLEGGAMPGSATKAKSGSAPITVNQEILRAAGLVRTLDKPLKVLGGGDVSTPLFVVADRFSASARAKIEAAGGSVNVLEVPSDKQPALKGDATATKTETATAEAPAAAAAVPDARPAPEAPAPASEAPAPASEAPAAATVTDDAGVDGAMVAETTTEPAAEAAEATPAEDVAIAAEPAPKARPARKPKAAADATAEPMSVEAAPGAEAAPKPRARRKPAVDTAADEA